jgi:hypothetical protein
MGTNTAPYSSSVSSTPDQQEQANCYQALLSQLWGKEPWFQGAYLWNWEVNPHPGDTLGYTPQDKLAEQVMSQYYSTPEPATLTLGLAGLGILSLFARRGKGSSPATGACVVRGPLQLARDH